jgi:hypothetical protein
MSCRICEVCGAKWIENQLYWSTGKPGKEIDLNALVCRELPLEKSSKCINPAKGLEGGMSWKERETALEYALDGL